MVSSIATQVGNAIANLSPDLGKIADAITTGKSIKDAIAALGELVASGLSNATGNLDLVAKNKGHVYVDLLKGKYTTPEALIAALFDPPPEESLGTRLFELLGALAGILGTAGAVGEILARPWIHEINALHQTEILSPEVLATLVVQGYISKTSAADEAMLSGLNKERFDLLYDVTGQPPGLGELLQLLNRGYMTDAEVTKAIQESRLKPKYTETIKKLRYILPPLADIIRMGVRDAWRDDVSAKYGYDQDMPDALITNAPKLGIDPDWMKRYWRAHWELPSISMVIDMLHRTSETGITPGDVDEFLRVQDVPQYWREKIRAVSYAPYTRVDVRRMYKTKTLTRDQVLAAYKALGYDDERAKNLTEFTVKLEDEAGQLNPDTLERKSYSALSNLFVRGKRGESDLRAAMQKYGWGDQAIDLELEIARLRAEAYKKIEDKDASGLTPTSVQRRIVEYTIDLYKKDAKSLGDVEAAMREYEWSDDIVTLMLKAANLEKLAAAKTDRKSTLRELSIGAILDAYESKTFNTSQATERLVGLGLSPDDAATEIAIRDYHIASKLRTSIVTALRDAFFNNDISETDLGIQLGNYGFDGNEIAGYTALWTIEKTLRRKRFTETQLAAFMKKAIITVDEYATELLRQGYTEQQVGWLLQLRGEI